MFKLIIKLNGIQIAYQLHPTRDAALVAAMDLVPSVEMSLEIVEVEK